VADLILHPDIFVSGEWVGILSDKVSAPDLAVEIFACRRLFDRTEKAAFYAQYGVREYWLVDPATEIIEVRRLEAAGQEVLGVYRRGDTIRSGILPDFALSVDAAFAE
jgi:Uma2 family endonuclease